MRRCWIALLLGLAACSPRVEPIPVAARDQPPAGAAPAGPWKAHGRLAVSWPRHHLEMECYLRRETGTLRYALIADGGISLAEGALPRVSPPKVQADIATHIPALERLLAEAYLIGPPTNSVWAGSIRRQDDQQRIRWYGGDPVLLRWVEGGGWPLEFSDYRLTHVGLIAHQVRADGPWGAELSVRLDRVE